MTNQTGIFIVIEGMDGSGKSTQAVELQKRIIKEGYDVLRTREPGGSVGAEEVRNLLVTGSVDRWDKISELFLFTAARRNHVETLIKPALAEGNIVICDRFVPSTIAYQGYGHGVDINLILEVTKIALGDFEPDLTMLFVVDPLEAQHRIAARNGKEMRFESHDIEFQERVILGYSNVFSHKNMGKSKYTIDTTSRHNQSSSVCIETITSVVFNAVLSQINEQSPILQKRIISKVSS